MPIVGDAWRYVPNTKTEEGYYGAILGIYGKSSIEYNKRALCASDQNRGTDSMICTYNVK